MKTSRTQSKATRTRVWKIINLVVAVTTIWNVSSLSALAPKTALAAPASIWTTRTTCVDPDPQDENEYSNGETVYVRGNNFDANTTYYGTVTGQPGGASADPSEIVGTFSTTTDGDGYFCVAAYVIGSDGDLDDGVYTVDVYDNPDYDGSSKNDNYHVNGLLEYEVEVQKTVDPLDGSPFTLDSDHPWTWSTGSFTGHSQESTSLTLLDNHPITETPDLYPASDWSTEWSCIRIVGEGSFAVGDGTGRSFDPAQDWDSQPEAGAFYRCEFVNTELRDPASYLVVHKQYDDNGDGTIDRTNPASWTWDIVGGAQNNPAGQFVTLTPGSYTITEDAETNYSASWACGATQGTGTSFPITLTDGQEASCTFTNRFVPVTTIALDKTGPAQTNPGSQIIYNLAWSVAGNASATNAVITDPIPANTTFVSATNGGTFAAGTVTWNLGTQAPGANGTVSVTVTVSPTLTQPTTLVNTGTFDTDQTSPVSDTVNTNVLIPQVLGVETEPDLTLTKSVDPTVTNPGKTITYTLKVTSTGTEAATNVVITDTLPNGFTFADDGTSQKTWTFASLVVGTTQTITYDVIVGDNVAKGNYANLAVARADNVDPVTAEAIVEVRVPQVLGLATTGMGLRDYLVFSFGLMTLMAGLITIRRYRHALQLE